MSDRILWLTPSKGYTNNSGFVLDTALKKKGLNPAHIFFANLSSKVKDLTIWKQKGKRMVEFLNGARINAGKEGLDFFIDNIRPKLLVVNDIAALGIITGNSKYTLHVCRGSIYLYRGIPVIVTNYDAALLRSQKEFSWVLGFDFDKLKRWYDGKQKQEPKFVHEVLKNIQRVRDIFKWLARSPAVAIDIETRGRFITCIGYTGIV